MTVPAVKSPHLRKGTQAKLRGAGEELRNAPGKKVRKAEETALQKALAQQGKAKAAATAGGKLTASTREARDGAFTTALSGKFQGDSEKNKAARDAIEKLHGEKSKGFGKFKTEADAAKVLQEQYVDTGLIDSSSLEESGILRGKDGKYRINKDELKNAVLLKHGNADGKAAVDAHRDAINGAKQFTTEKNNAVNKAEEARIKAKDAGSEAVKEAERKYNQGEYDQTAQGHVKNDELRAQITAELAENHKFKYGDDLPQGTLKKMSELRDAEFEINGTKAKHLADAVTVNKDGDKIKSVSIDTTKVNINDLPEDIQRQLFKGKQRELIAKRELSWKHPLKSISSIWAKSNNWIRSLIVGGPLALLLGGGALAANRNSFGNTSSQQDQLQQAMMLQAMMAQGGGAEYGSAPTGTATL